MISLSRSRFGLDPESHPEDSSLRQSPNRWPVRAGWLLGRSIYLASLSHAAVQRPDASPSSAFTPQLLAQLPSMNYGKRDEDADSGLVKVDRTQVFQEGQAVCSGSDPARRPLPELTC